MRAARLLALRPRHLVRQRRGARAPPRGPRALRRTPLLPRRPRAHVALRCRALLPRRAFALVPRGLRLQLRRGPQQRHSREPDRAARARQRDH